MPDNETHGETPFFTVVFSVCAEHEQINVEFLYEGETLKRLNNDELVHTCFEAAVRTKAIVEVLTDDVNDLFESFDGAEEYTPNEFPDVIGE